MERLAAARKVSAALVMATLEAVAVAVAMVAPEGKGVGLQGHLKVALVV